MALEIKPTPTLKGADADRFIKLTESKGKAVSQKEVEKMTSLVDKVLANSSK